MENNEILNASSENEEKLNENIDASSVNTDEPLDKNVKLMSPARMVARRFFRSKLSIIGLIMVVGLFIFSFLGPLFYNQWGEIELDTSGRIEYTTTTVKVTD